MRFSPERSFKALRNKLLWSLSYRLNAARLRRLFSGRRILIIGGGPSARELSSVPADTVVLTCNSSLKLAADRGIRRVDLYYFHKRKAAWRASGLQDYVRRIPIGFFITNLPKLRRVTQKYQEEIKSRPRLLVDSNRNNFYLKRLLRCGHIGDIGPVHWTSAGLRLLQYALYFKAREIYVIGLDLSDDYFWGEKKRSIIEREFEEHVLEEFSRRFANIFSLSERSPITRYFPFKRLEPA